MRHHDSRSAAATTMGTKVVQQAMAAVATMVITTSDPLELAVLQTLRAQRQDADRQILAAALIDAGWRRAGLA